jgi:hypothetical protein
VIPRPDDERGQLLLIGAVALALTILGLALVTNTVLYTENVAPGETTLDTGDVEEFSDGGQSSVRSLLFRLNHAERNVTFAALEDAAERNTTGYSTALSQLSAASGTQFTRIVYRETNHSGTRIVQGVDRPLTYNGSHSTPDAGSDPADWEPVPSRTQIGWFVLNVDVQNTSERATRVSVGSGLGNEWTYRLNRSGGNVSVRVTDDDGVELASDSCGGVGTRVLLDLRRGTGLSGECSFPGFDQLSGPKSVAVEDGDNLVGRYGIVVNETWDDDESNTLDPASPAGGSESYPHCSDGGRQPPCLSPVVWTATVGMEYRSSNVGLNTNRTIQVYEAGPRTEVFGAGTLFTADTTGLKVIEGDSGAVTTIPATTGDTVEAAGRASTDVDGDGDEDVPYVTGTGAGAELKLVDTGGEVSSVVTSADVPSGDIQHDKTRLASGTWDGSDPSVFFVDDNNDRIYRATADGTVTEVAAPSNGAQGISGIDDIDGDDEDELVFADASQQLRYLEADGSVSSIPNGQLGSDGGVGAGTVADLDGDGTAAVVGVDGSNDIKINREASGGGTTVISDVTGGGEPAAAKAPITVADVDDDGGPEIVYVRNPPSTGSPDEIRYVDDPLVPGSRSVVTLTDTDGSTVDGSSETGVL